MFVLMDYNKNYSEVCLELEGKGCSPVTIFKLCLNGKKGISEQLERISELKSRIKPKFSAVEVLVERLENSSVGTVNSLKSRFDLVIGLGGLNKVNRFFLEDTQVDFLRDPHNVFFRSKMDFIHHFNSGINHVLGRLASERGIGFIFSLNFVSGKKKNVAKEFGRVCQNVRFARKFGVPIYLNFIVNNVSLIRDERELSRIGGLFDMDSKQKKEISLVIEQKILANRFKNSEKFVNSGISFK